MLLERLSPTPDRRMSLMALPSSSRNESAVGRAFVHVAEGLGAFGVVAPDAGDREARAFDERFDGSVEVAAAGDTTLERGEPVLPTRHVRVGERPCSTKWKVPPGRSTRRISSRARSTSEMVHSVQVVSTWSTLACGGSDGQQPGGEDTDEDDGERRADPW